MAPSINIKILPLTSKLTRVHFPFAKCLFLRNTQGRRKLFYGREWGEEGGGGGLSKNVGHHGWWTAKNYKEALTKTP